MTTLIKRKRSLADLLGPLDEPLDPMAATELLPLAWNGPHVALRLVEGFTTLLRLSMRGGPANLRSAWPKYMYEFADLAAQAETAELERTQERQNKVRVVPSGVEIGRAEKATYWPTQYLGVDPDLREAVNMIALAHALGLDAGWVARKRGGTADVWRRRHDEGCELIAAGLIRDRTKVF